MTSKKIDSVASQFQFNATGVNGYGVLDKKIPIPRMGSPYTDYHKLSFIQDLTREDR